MERKQATQIAFWGEYFNAYCNKKHKKRIFVVFFCVINFLLAYTVFSHKKP